MNGRIVILNGAPRAGKSSIATAIQELGDGVWVNLGVDVMRQATPQRLQPGIGLRPGEPDHPAAAAVPVLYAALYESIAAHSRLGVNVVTDVGHHDSQLFADCLARLAGLPVLVVGVLCALAEIVERRRATGFPTEEELARRWDDAVHVHPYDLEVDTSTFTPDECARLILERL